MDATKENTGYCNVRRSLLFRLLLIAVIFVGTVVVAQQPANSQPVDPAGQVDRQTKMESSNQRYLDSPFGTSSRQREMQALAANGQKLPMTTESIIWSEGDTQFVVETRFILADEEFVSELFQMIDTSSFESTTTGVNQGLSLIQNDYEFGEIPDNVSLSASVRNLPATWGAITAGQHDTITQAVRGTTNASMTQAPTVTMFDEQSGTVFDGAMRPFVVGVEAVETVRGEYQQVPVIQPIEEGTILRLYCRKAGDKVFLGSQLIFNQIESVETFTIRAGKSAGASIQIPKCNVDAIHLHTSLADNETLLIDTGHIRTNSRLKEKKGFQKLPYVGTMVGSDIEKHDQRMLVMLTVREIKSENK